MFPDRIVRPLRLAFIGGGINSAVGYCHFCASQLDGYWELVAGCFSESLAINGETGRAYCVDPGRLYGNWRDLLQQEIGHIDAVVVITPTPSHHEIVAACLKYGMPVICEKALTCNLADAQALVDQVRKRHGFAAVAYNYSGYPMIRELRQRIRAGHFGRILHFQAEMPQEGFSRLVGDYEPVRPQEWRLRDGPIPTLYLDLASHLHQLIYYLLDRKPLAVVADQARFGNFPEIVDHASALLRYENDMRGAAWFGKSALGHRNGLKLSLYGEQGSAIWEQSRPEQLQLASALGRRETLDMGSPLLLDVPQRYARFKAGHPAGFLEAFANIYVDIALALRDYLQFGSWVSDEVMGPELAAEGMALFEAMQKSVVTSSWVDVENQAL